MHDKLAQAADVGGDARRAARERLQRHHPERFVERRHDGEVGRRVVHAELGLVDEAEEVHAVGETGALSVRF